MAKISYDFDGQGNSIVHIYKDGSPFGQIKPMSDRDVFEFVHEDRHLADAINVLSGDHNTVTGMINDIQAFVNASILHKE